MNLDEYKKSKLRSYTCPSGFVIKTKNLSPYTSLKLRTEIDKDAKGDLLSPKLIEALFQSFIVSPKIPDEMIVDDFTSEDFKSILDTIIQQIALTKGKQLEEIVDKDKDFRR